MYNNNVEYSDPIVVQTSVQVTVAVIWLHGLGADGGDFSPIVPMLGLPDSLGVEFIFPHAPRIPVTVNGGMHMRAWYNIVDMNCLELTKDTKRLHQSCAYIMTLVRKAAEKYGWKNVILAGFSQGGALVASVVNYLPQPIAGIVCLSTYLAETLQPQTNLQAMAALVMHGKLDPVVPVSAGAKLAQQLSQKGFNVEYHTWEMAHQVLPQQVIDIGKWITKNTCHPYN